MLKISFEDLNLSTIYPDVPVITEKSIHANVSPLLGCDPEMFFASPGGVVGAEKVITETGLKDDPYARFGYMGSKKFGFVLDGVQVELNPAPYTCRERLACEMSKHFRNLHKHLQALKDKQISINFRQSVELSKAELDSLSDEAKKLGCAPSLNHYDKAASISVDPATYAKRSAGGHIHLGLTGSPMPKKLMVNRERLVPLLDVFLGNTCVLLDRDPGNRERRKVYGRAGEYRLPSHGLEYRTLSNFWLRSYPLMSFVMGMARFGVNVLGEALGMSVSTGSAKVSSSLHPYGHKYVAIQSQPFLDVEAELFTLVDLDAVRTAINENDVELAWKNWRQVRFFLEKFVRSGKTTHGFFRSGSNFSLNDIRAENFERFVKGINTHGLEWWFPEDPLTHWCGIGHSYYDNGWESFVDRVVPTKCKRLGG